jgi:hypothetical protein
MLDDKCRTLLHQITSGVAGWLTFQHMKNNADIFDESSVYLPIIELAMGRQCEVLREFPIPKESENKIPRKGTKEIDFLVVSRRKKIVIMLEVKFKKSGKPMAGGIAKDVAKLLSVEINDIVKQIKAGKTYPIRRPIEATYRVARAVMVIWRGNAVFDQMKKEDDVIKKQFKKLFAQLVSTNSDWEKSKQWFNKNKPYKPILTKYGSMRAASTKSVKKRFWVMTLFEIPDWKKVIEAGR